MLPGQEYAGCTGAYDMKDSVFRRCVERRFDFPKHVLLDFRNGSRSCLLAIKLPKNISLSAHVPNVRSNWKAV